MSLSPGHTATNAKILVVDDHAVNCELLDAMLSPVGYEVLQTGSGEEALEVVLAEKPDLVLLDVNMPGMDGFEVARRLRAQEQTATIPVIMVTALGDLEHKLQGLESGADEYLAKPINHKELIARVQSSLKLSQLRSQVDERKKLELILGDVSDGIVILDSKAHIHDVSPSARRLLAQGAVSLKGKGIDKIWGPLHGVPESLMQDVVEGKSKDFEVHRETPTLVISANLRPVHDASGHPTGAVLRLCDVTREANERKLQQDFLSLISHKFRTPLTVAALWTKILLDGELGEVNKQQSESLEAVRDSTQQIQDLLDGMLSYLEWSKRLQQMQRTSISPKRIEELLRARVGTILEPSDQIEITRSSDAEIVVDTGMFLEAVLELVQNAVKFSGDSHAEIKISMREENGHSIVEVSDQGSGVPSEELERIFQRFYQVESDFTGQVSGLGLGLAKVRSALEAMGARLQVESVLGEGTSFKITL